MINIEDVRQVPVNQKFTLTISEACEYFNIGENKIREMIKDPLCDFCLHIGKKNLIKREKMENYLLGVSYL